MGLFDRGVAKTKQSFFQKVSRAIVGKSRVDDSVLDAMEEALVATDMGVDTTLKIIDNLQDRVEKDKYMSMETARRERQCRGSRTVRLLEETVCRPRGRRKRSREDHHHRQAGIDA